MHASNAAWMMVRARVGGGGGDPFYFESSGEEEEEEGEVAPPPLSLPHETLPSFGDILNR
jgi:hypothetical protein